MSVKHQRHTKSQSQSTAMLTVQCVACGVLLLIALIIRLIGGGIYKQTQEILRTVMTDNGIVEVWEKTDA